MKFANTMYLGMHPQIHGSQALRTGEFSIGVSGEYSSGTDRRVEIALSNGHRLIVEGGFDGTEVARLLKGLVS